jgi:hypothetical protein
VSAPTGDIGRAHQGERFNTVTYRHHTITRRNSPGSGAY